MAETPLGIRNNNPGNLLAEQPRWMGELEPFGRYCVFSAPIYGIRALAKQLIIYQIQHRCRSIRDFVSRWAPSNENDTEAYIKDVAVRMDIPEEKFILVAVDATLRDLVKAIIWHENGQMPYSDQEINSAIREARE